MVPASTEPGLSARLAVEAAARGRSVTYLSVAPAELEGVAVLVWDDDLSIPTELLDVAGPLVAWQMG